LSNLILLFFVAFGATMLILNLTNPKEVELPNVVGLTREEAEQKIKTAKLNFEIESEEYNIDVEENHIISQDPKYVQNYNRVKEGSTVKVVISKGTEKTIVPNVKGKEKEEAIELIEDAKLKAEIIEETSKTVKEGFVISQETEPNIEANAGDTIKIHISTGTGIKQVTMVDVTGKKEAEAKSSIEALGLVANIGYSEDTSKDNGIVLKQSIEVGKVIDEGTTVTITVNKLAEIKSVPIKINVKSLLDGKITETIKDENDEEIEKVKDVKLEVKVGDDIIYSQKVKASETSISAGTAKGTGTTTVRVYVDGILKNQNTLNYSTTTSYTVEKSN